MNDQAEEAGIREDQRRNRGLSAADFDGDGDIDLFLANPLDGSQLYWNRGDCTFAPATNTPTSGQDAASSAVDFDGDGDLDLFLACGGFEGTCANRLFRNDGLDSAGEVVFVDVSEAAGLLSLVNASFGGAWADHDGDGDLDLFMPSKLETEDPDPVPVRDALLRNNGDGTFSDVTFEAGLHELHLSDHHQAAWLDADLDGDPDLFVPAFAGINRFFLNQGDGTFEEAGASAFLQLPWAAFGALAEDFDQDGDLDLLVSAHASHGYEDLGELHDQSTWFENDGQGRFSNRTSDVGLPWEPSFAHTEEDAHVGTMGFQVGDLDLDGNLDVFFGNGSPFSGQVNGLWEAEAEAGWVSFVDQSWLIDQAPSRGDGYPYRSHGAAFFDCDGDETVDLVIGNGGDSSGPEQKEPNRLFLSRYTEAPSWVEVNLDGAGDNTHAVGARVEVEHAGGTVWRHQTLASGFNSSVPTGIRVGLGANDGPYTVTAHWPWGGTTTVSGVVSGDRVLLVQPNREADEP